MAEEEKLLRMNVNFERCKGCGLCVPVCPKKIIVIQSEKLNAKGYYTSRCIDDEKCISCCRCAIMCPDSAITIKDFKDLNKK